MNQTKQSVYDLVRICLKSPKGKKLKSYTYGGTIERYVSARHTAKGSTVSRMLRDMQIAGEIEAAYDKKMRGAVMYRLV